MGENGAVSRFPCPCCGHLTLPTGPGDYELCPVCFWEDDGGQLRFPMSANGANGISLMEGQKVYQRIGAMDKSFKREVRQPKSDEPLDTGWRPFDPARDWTDPALDSDRWPVNAEALYYWRPTYWNGDQHKLPLPPHEPTNDDRLLLHLRREVPELGEAIATSERRWGRAGAFDVCRSAALLALSSYAEGNDELGQRIVTALTPAVDESSDASSPNCVFLAFLEDERWHEPWVQKHVDQWPPPIRDELRSQQNFRAQHEADFELRRKAWADLHRTARGQPIEVIAERLRSTEGLGYEHRELGRELTARVISNPRWLYRHPLDSLHLAWRYRGVLHPWRTLRWLHAPRSIG